MGERSGRREAEHCPRGNRFSSQSVRRCEASVGEFFGGEQADEAVERYTMHSQHRAARDGEGAHEVVGGFLHRRDDEDFGRWRLRLEPRARGGDTLGGARGDYDFTSSWHRRGATRCRATSLCCAPRIAASRAAAALFPQRGQRLSTERVVSATYLFVLCAGAMANGPATVFVIASIAFSSDPIAFMIAPVAPDISSCRLAVTRAALASIESSSPWHRGITYRASSS